MASAAQTFSPEQRARAVELLETESVWAATSEIGCSHVSVYRWHAVRAQNNGAEAEAEDLALQSILRQRLRRRLLETAMAHVDRSDAARSAGDAQRYMTSAAIALDKYRLEMGEATARHYVEGHDDIDRRVSQLVAEMDTRGQAQAISSALVEPTPNGADHT
jgi:transposase-like protein